MKINKKAQEEIIGFVLIVVIVAVIFLIFLGISLRNQAPVTQREGGDVSQFLESVMEYTSSCAISSESAYLSIGELVKECYSGSTCRSGTGSCLVLRQMLQEIIETNWKIGADRPVKGYVFNATYVSEATKKDVMLLTKGECKTEKIGAEMPISAYPGNIETSLQICY